MLNAKTRRGKDAKRLAVRMARAGGISVSRAAALQERLTEIFMEGLLADGEIRINGFGVMRIVERSDKVWDPQRRRMVERRFKRVVRFRGSDLTQRRGDAEGAEAKSKCLTQRRKGAKWQRDG